MRKEYTAPEAEIEKFIIECDICTLSEPGQGSGDSEYDDPWADDDGF